MPNKVELHPWPCRILVSYGVINDKDRFDSIDEICVQMWFDFKKLGFNKPILMRKRKNAK